jgi:hypothetical protein
MNDFLLGILVGMIFRMMLLAIISIIKRKGYRFSDAEKIVNYIDGGLLPILLILFIFYAFMKG